MLEDPAPEKPNIKHSFNEISEANKSEQLVLQENSV